MIILFIIVWLVFSIFYFRKELFSSYYHLPSKAPTLTGIERAEQDDIMGVARSNSIETVQDVEQQKEEQEQLQKEYQEEEQSVSVEYDEGFTSNDCIKTLEVINSEEATPDDIVVTGHTLVKIKTQANDLFEALTRDNPDKSAILMKVAKIVTSTEEEEDENPDTDINQFVT